jgi:hypothetical protein
VTRAEPAVRRSFGTPSRRLRYAAVLLVAIAAGGVAARASNAVTESFMRFVMPDFVSSTPLGPGIHAADRLSIAEAQLRMPFAIVVPQGLPAGTRLMYAHVISEGPVSQVSLMYEAFLDGKYRRIAIAESNVPVGPPVTHFDLVSKNGHEERWTEPLRRWKRGAVVIDMSAYGLPSDVADRIVRANGP